MNFHSNHFSEGSSISVNLDHMNSFPFFDEVTLCAAGFFNATNLLDSVLYDFKRKSVVHRQSLVLFIIVP